MKFSPTQLRESARSCRGAIARTLFALLAVLFVALGAPGKASAQTPPTINGDLTDLIQFATDLRNNVKGVGIEQDDPAGETLVTDPKAIPCPTIVGQYYQNGFDQTKYVLAQAGGSSTLYLGVRAAGIIGDTDGNGNPDNSGGGMCNPQDNITDQPGIANDESYTFYFDTNCGAIFTPTSTITITNDKVTGTGIFSGVTGSVADGSINYRGGNGHDLEVKVLNAKLPPAFKVRTIVGSIPDGLAEDFGAIVLWEPHPNLTITKVADPVRVCVGKNTRFTLTVTNTGDCDLATVVEDDLPAGLAFAGNVSTTCNVGAPQVNGSAIQWPSFNLPFGASCTISFDVTASAGCFGLVTNNAHADGAVTGPCVNQPPAHSETQFAVTCVDNPCVTVTASGPAHACPNTQVTISGNITSCSKNDETVVVTVNGVQAFSGPVAAGATVPYTFQAPMGACTAGGNVTFKVHAVATGECGTAPADAPDVQVRCDDVPCLELTADRNPASACPGATITVSGTVKNCSLDPENILVTINGVQVFNGPVAGGVTQPYTHDFTLPACQTGDAVPYAVVATATNQCDQKGVTKTSNLSVICKNAPCVQLLNVKANLDAACPNTPIVISGTVKNCGADVATYTVTVGGVQVFTGDLAAGATQDFTGNGTMGACVAGSQVTFAVHASAHNSCGDAATDGSASVRCKDQPCVELVADRNPAAACPGATITVSGTVKNCSLDPENILVTVNGTQVFNGPVAPGVVQQYTHDFIMPACTSGSQVPYDVVALATNDCNPQGVSKDVPLSVTCQNAPCVQLLNVKSDVDAACPNAPVNISGTVKNCGADLATYTVTINGQQAFTGDLAAGATHDFTLQLNMGACKAGAQVPFAVHATAHNSCGDAATDASVSVRCKDLPCVNLTADANPKSACPGDKITVAGSVTNCSLDPENIVVTINGTQVFNGPVAAGAVQQYTHDFTMPACTSGSQVPFAVHAVATNDCNPDGVTKDLSPTVTCKNTPCVQLLNVHANVDAACPNAPVTISGTVKNCGADVATYTVTVGGVQVFTGDLAPGATQDFQGTVNMGQCQAGAQVPFAVHATAHNSCGDAPADSPVSVRCKDLPCVNLTAAANPVSACPGDKITVSGTVTNCSLDPENIVVTINGDQVFNGPVAAGASQPYTKDYTMPACQAGGTVPYAVHAVATNDCNPQGVAKDLTPTVLCKNPPCVQLINVHANVDAACPNAPVTISGTVKNCGSDTATYTVTIAGVQAFTGDLAAGATQDFQGTVNMGACKAGGQVPFAVHASAHNSCGDAAADSPVSVRCKDLPCVDLTGAPDVSAQCPGQPVNVSGNVHNCSLDPENIVVTINGVQVFNGPVAAGATQPYTHQFTMPACDAGSAVPFNVVAVATNDCNPQGVTKNLPLSVTCKNPPCVQASALCNPSAACPGTPIVVTGSAKNCSPSAEDITITIEGQAQTFQAVAAGQTVSWQKTVVLRACTAGEQVAYNVSATATNDCGTSQPSAASCTVTCQQPQVQISKTASPSGAVDQGTKLTYTITVTNPSKTVGLDNVVVTDHLCSSVTYQGNATPAPASAPAIGAVGDVTWNLGSLAPGAVVTITFDATVVTLPAPDCQAKNLSCTNNVDVTANCADAQATAHASYTTPINPCPTPGLCRLTGGGCLNEDSGNKGHKQNTFGGNSSPLHTGGGPSGNSWEHIQRDGKTILFNWHSWDDHVIACSVVPPGPCSPKAPDTRADFVGTGKYSFGSGGRDQDGNMVAYVIDHTEGACNKGVGDYYSIVIRKGLVIGEGDVVFTCAGTIDCGNLQIHALSPNEIVTGLTTAQPGLGNLTTGTALLNRAVPNPFSSSTSFAFKVPDGGAAVDVGVYNVAGRLVKTLASGTQGAGIVTVTWDGTDNGGVRMAPGVYFLRSRIGSESNVTRVIYISR